jgi:integrase
MHNTKTAPTPAMSEPSWSKVQQRFLAVLEHEEHRTKTVTEICQLAGYASKDSWYSALRDERFAAVIDSFGIKGRRTYGHTTDAQQRLLEVLKHEENHRKSVVEIRRLANCSESAWRWAIADERFASALRALNIPVRRNMRTPHLEVTLATNVEEELAKDVWDMRRLKSEYPKHRAPAKYEVVFSWIVNPLLREQIKSYFRQRLTRWEAVTFQCVLNHMKPVLLLLPPEIHMGTIQRSDIETLLPHLAQLSQGQVNRALENLQIICEYMATSLAWTGPRPPRFLIWDEDIPPRPESLPRPIPPDVLDQLDPLLEQAAKAMKEGQVPPILAPVFWDALIILRHTGMRFEDVAHLKTPDEHGKKGCLDQDAEGYWWICIDSVNTKMKRDHRIPTREADGVVDAIRRQQERAKQFPDHFEAHYLFRIERGILTCGRIESALDKLASHLTHEGQPYLVTPHQFRHSIATDMIEQGVDIYTVKEFLGHKSLSMTEKYVKVYLSSLKAKYDAYRLKKQQTSASEMMSQVQVAQPEGDADGGWLENKVGKLYVSPLPDGIGNCVHLPMHDGCPDSPHCPTCPKLRANKRHLPVWESKATNLLITVEALRANPAYGRARQKHEQELAHAEKVIKTIKEEGFWDGRIHNSKTHES